jgi:hypothetical protein
MSLAKVAMRRAASPFQLAGNELFLKRAETQHA